MKNLDKYRGCLIGGAIGDALGYAVEFKKIEEIQEIYGENGITQYKLTDRKALISDETQMTLFTAVGLLVGKTRQQINDTSQEYTSYLATSYSEWLYTQQEEELQDNKTYYTWLCNVPELYSRRAPENTSIVSIYSGEIGTTEEPINNSNSYGGVVRVAPIGLCFDSDELALKEIDTIGANSAAITHGHGLGYIPAEALVHIIHLISHGYEMTLLDSIMDMKQKIYTRHKSNQHIKIKDLEYFIMLIDRAIDLSDRDIEDTEAIQMLGRGLVAEETLAIAIYCSLKYHNNFEKGIIAAANHTGATDSTASVTGNILGAYLGYEKIPYKFKDKLEIEEVIMEVANDLYNSGQRDYIDKKWEDKYIYATYTPDKLEKIV